MNTKIKNVLYNLFIKKNISNYKKKQFYSFGKNSIIEKPYLQLSGTSNISIGKNVTILKNSRLAVYGNNSKSSKIIIGENTYIGFGFTALAYEKSNIKIGNNVLIASNVLITNENHGINPEIEDYYMNQELSSNDTIIDDGCWIGEKVCILSGVTIGKKSIIGAGSIVTKSIPSYSIAVGNPAVVIKKYNFKDHCWEKVSNEKE